MDPNSQNQALNEGNSEISLGDIERYISEGLVSPSSDELRAVIASLHNSEVADLLQRLPRPTRLDVWNAIETERQGYVLLELGDAVRAFIVESVDTASLSEAASYLESDDLAVLVRALSSERAETLISLLDRSSQRRVSKVLTYEAGKAGSLMNLEVLKAHPENTVRTVITHLRNTPEMTLSNDVVFVVDEQDRLAGSLLIKDLLLHSSQKAISEIMDAQAASVLASDTVDEAIRIIRDRDLIALAVVNDQGALLGQITVDDAVDVVDERRAQSVAGSVGALTQDEDLFAPVWQSSVQRAVWLGINLVTAFLASAVVNAFGVTIEQAVSLAVLMPIVASMGGIAGSQTMVLVIRGIALNLVTDENMPKIAYKELLVGAANGVLWAIIIAVLVYVWMGEWWLMTIIMLSILVNILVGTLSGVVLPLFLRFIGADPAISANVILTTVTDVVGLGFFLGLASLYLG